MTLCWNRWQRGRAATLRGFQQRIDLWYGNFSFWHRGASVFGRSPRQRKRQRTASGSLRMRDSTEVERWLAVRRCHGRLALDATNQPHRIHDQHLSRAVGQPDSVRRVGKRSAEHLKRQNQIAGEKENSTQRQQDEATIGQSQA